MRTKETAIPQRRSIEPFDLHGLKTIPLAARPSKVCADDLGRLLPSTPVMGDFLDRLPKQLAANSLRRLCGHLCRIARENRLCVCAIGGHVIKTGCAPYLIDLLRRGVIGAIAMNGAAAIHDLELALVGKTSEDVGPRLRDGSFGMAAETARLFAVAAKNAKERGIGLGRALGETLDSQHCTHPASSILVQAFRIDAPCTVHVAFGADVVHMHPELDAGALGESTLFDFRMLTTLVSQLSEGLWMNIGCAVIMPEVFLKAVAIVRNFGHSLDGLVTANLDMIQQYRGRVNVCERPGDEGIAITGHHELLIPLIHAIVAGTLEQQASQSEFAGRQLATTYSTEPVLSMRK